MDDDFNPKKFGMSPELADKIAAARAAAEAKRAGGGKPFKRARSQRQFTKFPYRWEETLAKARVSGATWVVAHVLLYEAWRLITRGDKPVVKLADIWLKPLRVKAKGKRNALQKLEELNLVAVERRSNKNPTVMVHHLG